MRPFYMTALNTILYCVLFRELGSIEGNIHNTKNYNEIRLKQQLRRRKKNHMSAQDKIQLLGDLEQIRVTAFDA